MTLICARHPQRRLRLRGRPWTAEAWSEILNRTRCTLETCARTGRPFLSPPFMTPEAKQIYGACNAKWRRFKRELAGRARSRSRGRIPSAVPASQGESLLINQSLFQIAELRIAYTVRFRIQTFLAFRNCVVHSVPA